MLRRIASLLFCASLLFGCQAHQARSAGATLATLGFATTIVGVGVTAGCEPFPAEEEDTCQSDDWEPDTANGVRILNLGLFLVGLGVILYATGEADKDPPPSEPEALE